MWLQVIQFLAEITLVFQDLDKLSCNIQSYFIQRNFFSYHLRYHVEILPCTSASLQRWWKEKDESAPHRMFIRAPVGLEHPQKAHKHREEAWKHFKAWVDTQIASWGRRISIGGLSQPHTSPPYVSALFTFPLTVTMRILKSISLPSLLQIPKCFKMKMVQEEGAKAEAGRTWVKNWQWLQAKGTGKRHWTEVRRLWVSHLFSH